MSNITQTNAPAAFLEDEPRLVMLGKSMLKNVIKLLVLKLVRHNFNDSIINYVKLAYEDLFDVLFSWRRKK